MDVVEDVQNIVVYVANAITVQTFLKVDLCQLKVKPAEDHFHGALAETCLC